MLSTGRHLANLLTAAEDLMLHDPTVWNVPSGQIHRERRFWARTGRSGHGEPLLVGVEFLGNEVIVMVLLLCEHTRKVGRTSNR